MTSAARRVPAGTTNSSTRSAPSETTAKRSRNATSTFRRCTSGCPNRSATSVWTVCTRPRISSLDPLVESTVVIGDLSQQQMVTKEHTEHQKALHRSVYNDWGLYQFVQMLSYQCLPAGKVLEVLDERETSKTCSGCGHTQPCRCGSARIAVGTVGSRWTGM